VSDEKADRSVPRPTWRAIETIPVFLLALVATALLTYAVAAVVATILGWPIGRILTPARNDSTGCTAMSLVAVSSMEVASLATVLLWVRLVSKSPLAALGAPRQPWRDVALGLGAGVLIVIAGTVSLTITTAIASAILGHPPRPPVQVASCVRSGAALAAMGAVVVVAAPIAEETLFRGFLYAGLRRRFSVGPAALVSGTLFGAVHYAGSEFALIIPSLILVGIGLALVYERRSSLLASITAHAAFNLIGFAMIVADRVRVS
jgi:membrane protease YdiL (CAAX protease family)